MAKASDVAAAILEHYRKPMSAMKLQKLLYYCQAWHLVWTRVPLFEERIEAWAKGPVVADLYKFHRGQFEVANWPPGNASALSATERSAIEAVLAVYGTLSARSLSERTHSELPWLQARAGLPDGASSNAQISHESMIRFYKSVT